MKPMFHSQLARQARNQRGVTLIEALVALMIMSFGMVALVGLMSNLRRSNDVAKQRSEAMRLAQTEIGNLRFFSKLKKDPGDGPTVFDYDTDIVSTPAAYITPENSNAVFVIKRDVSAVVANSPEPAASTVQVAVSWVDRASSPQTLLVTSVIARVDPAFAGALSVTPPADGVRQPSGQNPAIPVGAKDLGNKLSAYKPSGTSGTVWVFNNFTGVIVGKCSILDKTLSQLTAADVESCNNNTVGYLISGTVRFSNTSPANPAMPEATAVPLGVGLSLTAASNVDPKYECFNNAPTTSPSTQQFVNYDCIVYPNADSPRIWSGQLLLSGLTLGTLPTQYRVCRYSADYNSDGKTTNEEHPATYTSVAGSLARQNFLVVRGDLTCPTAPAVNLSTGVFVNYSTAQLQP